MANDAGERRRPAPSGRQDPDSVDFTWLSGFARRLARRMYTPPGDGRPPGDGAPPGTVPEAEPGTRYPTSVTVSPRGSSISPGEDGRIIAYLRRVRASDRYMAARKNYALPLLLAVIVGVICLNNHFGGVDWGDDFALYMRQARALTIGNIGEVLAQNRFAVDNSGWHSFSPDSYPWGWPLLVAPFYVKFGLDYNVFKTLEVAALSTFLFFFFLIVRKRAGTLPAVALTLLIGLSPMYVGGTDTVLSDLPYLCFVGLSLWWMDRCREKGILTCRRRDLVVLGGLLAFTFNIRREGLALFAALASVQGAVLLGLVVRQRSRDALRAVDWRKVALPYLTILVAVVAMQVLLPTVLFPDLPGTGLQNASRHITFYKDALAEHLGLKDPGGVTNLWGNQVVGTRILALFVILAAIGLIGRLLYRFEEDVTLVSYLVVAGFIMLVSPYQDGRYLFTITPLMAYFAYQALPTIGRMSAWREKGLQVARIVPCVGLAGLIMLNGRDLAHSLNYHRHNQVTIHGPESADAQQLFQAVRDQTRGDDVILFFRARAMTLYTDRLALQGSDLDQMLKRVDYYAMERNSTYSQTPLTDAEGSARGLTKVWENSEWVLWRVPRPS